MRKARTNSVLYTWLISYLVILIFSILFGSYAYNYLENFVEREIKQSVNSVTQTLLSKGNDILDETLHVNRVLSGNRRLLEISLFKRPLSSSELYAMYEQTSDIRALTLSDRLEALFFLYMPSSDYVIDSKSVVPSSDFYRSINNQELSGYEEWLDGLKQTKSLSEGVQAFSINSGVKREYITIYQPLSTQSGNRINVIGVIMIPKDIFISVLSSQNISVDAFYLILNRNGNIITSTYPGELELPMLGDVEGETETVIDGKRFMLTFTGTKYTGWRFVSLIPAQHASERLGGLRYWAAIILIVYFIIGLGCVAFMLKFNYKPFQKLIGGIYQSDEASKNKSRNEYQIIQQIITRISDESARANTILDKQMNMMKNAFLTRLLNGDMYDSHFNEMAEHYNIHLISDHFIVMLFFIENLDKYMATYTDMTQKEAFSSAKFAVKNIMEELINRRNYAMAVDIEDMCAIIVNVREENLNFVYEQLKDDLKYAQSVIAEHFGFTFVTSISDIQKATESVAEAYQEALNAMEYKFFHKNLDILLYRDVYFTDNKTYYYPIEKERQIINYVMLGQDAEAVNMLNEIFELNFSKQQLTLTASKSLMFDLISTLLKIENELFGKTGQSPVSESIERLANLSGIEAMQKEIYQILKVCAGSVQRELDNPICRKIEEYVEHNYADPNLNVALIAESLKMNSSYLSTVFKEYTGEQLLNYVMKYRHEKALLLLNSNENTKISDVARAVGYVNVRSFWRTFRKYEGMPPTKYLEVQNSKQIQNNKE